MYQLLGGSKLLGGKQHRWGNKEKILGQESDRKTNSNIRFILLSRLSSNNLSDVYFTFWLRPSFKFQLKNDVYSRDLEPI